MQQSDSARRRPGSSLGCCLVACLGVLWQPAAASSGIPELIAYLNGIVPLGGKSPVGKKRMTDFRRSAPWQPGLPCRWRALLMLVLVVRSWQTLVAKLFGMILSIPSGKFDTSPRCCPRCCCSPAVRCALGSATARCPLPAARCPLLSGC